MLEKVVELCVDESKKEKFFPGLRDQVSSKSEALAEKARAAVRSRCVSILLNCDDLVVELALFLLVICDRSCKAVRLD